MGNIDTYRCCCTVSYQIAAQIFAALFITQDIFAFFGIAAGFTYYEYSNPDKTFNSTIIDSEQGFGMDKYLKFDQIFVGDVVIVLLILGMDASMNILLWTGASNVQIKHCKKWLKYTYVVSIILLILLLVDLLSLKVTISFGVAFFNLFFRGYALFIVRCLVMDIKDNPRGYMRQLVPE